METLRKGGKKTGKIVGYKGRVPNGKGGWKTKTFSFKSFEEPRAKAKEWELKENRKRKLRREGFNTEELDREELSGWTVLELVSSYMSSNPDYRTSLEDFLEDKADLVERCELQNNLAEVVHKFAIGKYHNMSLYDFNSSMVEKYIEEMRSATYTSHGSTVKKKYSQSTIRRNADAIKNVWDWGKKIPGLENLKNPWKDLPFKKLLPGTGAKRQRGLKKGELEKLIKHCDRLRGSNSYYVPLAIRVFVDTAMRRQELFDLTWQDVDFDNRRIHIKHDKNSWRRLQKEMPEDRLICLPFLSQAFLLELFVSLVQDGLTPSTPGMKRFPVPKEFHPPTGKIFMSFEKTPMTGRGFEQAFEQVRDWAGIVDTNPRKQLTPHSLRAAAESGYRRARMLDKEIDVQKNGIKSHYDVEEDLLAIVQDQLDKAFFGKPLADMEKENEATHIEFQSLLKDRLLAGKETETAVAEVTAEMLQKYPQYKTGNAWTNWVRRLTTVSFSQLAATQAQLVEEPT